MANSVYGYYCGWLNMRSNLCRSTDAGMIHIHTHTHIYTGWLKVMWLQKFIGKKVIDKRLEHTVAEMILNFLSNG
jgi:hypothetical protein